MQPTSPLRTARLYALLVGIPFLALAGVLRVGSGLPSPASTPAAAEGLGGRGSAAAGVPMPDLPLLLVQVAVIIVAARLVGRAVRVLRQPQVVGEMIAGLLLGPSLLGWAAPGLSAALFPAGSLGFLNSLSQVGLIVFMFVVGLELDVGRLRERSQIAIVTSHASIVAPFTLGAALALVLYERLAPVGVSFSGFALFMGAAMSVTAFPVLARILTERQLLRTRLGTVAITCAAVDDVSAWCILAAVVFIVRAGVDAPAPWLAVGGTVVYVAAMVLVARPLLAGVERAFVARGRLTQDVLAGVVVFVFASAWATERLGIHALFGAFLAGAVMPKHEGLAHALLQRLEDVMVVLLLPLFFAFTGLRTRVGLISGAELWGYCALVFAVATAGKLGGSTLAARVTGMPWREATALGVLMNTRGLMELVILNVGLDVGVISPPLFAMMVLMALSTTVMTTPLLEWLYPAARGHRGEGTPASVVPSPADRPRRHRRTR